MSRLGALTVDDRRTRARFASGLLARHDIERMVDAGQRAVPVPQHEVIVRSALRRQVLRQGLPLAAGRQHVANGVQNLADIHVPRPAAVLGWWYHRLNQRPLGVGEVTRITKAMPLRRVAVFRLPHQALLCESSAHQGITTDLSDLTSSWIGS